MTRVLELHDETVDSSTPTGQTATLNDDGTVTFDGDQIQAIMTQGLARYKPEKVFDNMAGWSNGYSASIKERG